MVKCIVCYERYIIDNDFSQNNRHPVTIRRCGHTLCNGCAKKMIDKINLPFNNILEEGRDNEGERVFACPKCTQISRWPDKLTMEELLIPRVYELERLIEKWNRKICNHVGKEMYTA